MIEDAIKRAVEVEIQRAVEDAVKKAQSDLAYRIPQIVAVLSLVVMKNFSMERLKDEVLIRVKMP